MSLGPVMVDLRGPALSAGERELLLHPLVGGVLLFTRNYENPEQLAALVAEIHALRRPQLLVAVDHEGGRVQRFRHEFTVLPSASTLGLLHDRDPRLARRMAELTGWLMAVELRAVGVDFSFAPVLDLATAGNEAIGDRAFHRRPEVVASLAHAYVAGEVLAGGGHAGAAHPGHGSVRGDSHHTLPVDGRPYADIAAEDLLPFERLIEAGLAAVMPAHVVYSQVDPLPAGFSPFWIGEVLRRRLGFQGVVFSDDLSMAGAEFAGGYPERARTALAAGCDMVLVCNNPEAAAVVVERLGGHHDPASHLRLVRLHGRQPLTRRELRQNPQWRQAVAAVQEYEQSLTPDLGL